MKSKVSSWVVAALMIANMGGQALAETAADVAVTANPSTKPAAPAHWGYSGEAGPEHWAKLTPEFGMCSGKNQSPINLTHFIEADLKPIAFAYHKGGNQIVNNGHTIQINYAPGTTIKIDGDTFTLKQFHFHAPSENLIDGHSYPLEGHLVHADKDGNLAVVAVMFQKGAANPMLEQIVKNAPHEAGQTEALPADLNATHLLPKNRDYYRFNGSLTTPPCSEGVRWLVMKHPMTASEAQIEAFGHLFHHANNRPVQPVNARPVLR